MELHHVLLVDPAQDCDGAVKQRLQRNFLQRKRSVTKTCYYKPAYDCTCLKLPPLRMHRVRRCRSARRQQSQHLFDYRVDAQTGGIDADGIFSRTQRRHRTLGVAGVAGKNLPQQTI